MGTNWLDVILLAVIGWNCFIGLKHGFVGGVSRLAGAVLGLVAALNFYRPLSDTVNLKWNLVSTIGGRMPVTAWETTGSSATVGSWFASQGPVQALQGVGKSLAGVLASGILDILCFVFLFVTVSWMVKALGTLLAKIAKIIFLGPFDRAGGLLLGAAKGLLVAMIMVALANSMQVPAAFISSHYDNNAISLALQKSTLAPYFIKALVVLNVSFPGWSI